MKLGHWEVIKLRGGVLIYGIGAPIKEAQDPLIYMWCTEVSFMTQEMDPNQTCNLRVPHYYTCQPPEL